MKTCKHIQDSLSVSHVFASWSGHLSYERFAAAGLDAANAVQAAIVYQDLFDALVLL